MITVLSGGVGAARMLRALSLVVEETEICAVVNVGDDLKLHGLTICPDLDTIMYTLAGVNNETAGWGLDGETWRVMEELERLGGTSWFRLGDRDLATHLYRSQRLDEGATKTDVTLELAHHFNLRIRLLPVTDDALATTFETELGTMSFQDYFVRHRHAITVSAITVTGASSARLSERARAALLDAERIVVAPSNPLISIDPILQVPGVREILRQRRGDVVAVSPIINGVAIKGPADRLLRELGHDPSCFGVAEFYREVVGTVVIDDVDAGRANAIRDLGMSVVTTTTVMSRSENAVRLAHAVLA